MSTSNVSVIVVTFRRELVLIHTLQSILKDLPRGAELVVVDQTEQHSDETTSALSALESDPRVRIHRVTPASIAGARNYGVRHSSGEIIIFFDDDVLLKPGCVTQHVAAFDDDKSIGGVVGRVEHPGQAIAPHLYRMDHFGRESGGFNWLNQENATTLNGANMSFRRTALQEAGPWDVSYIGNGWREESDVAHRLITAGWRLRFAPEAHLLHLADPEGGARSFGSDYYLSPAIYQNETIFFLRRFGWTRLPGLAWSLARRGVIRKSALRQRTLLRRAISLVSGMATGIQRVRKPAHLELVARD